MLSTTDMQACYNGHARALSNVRRNNRPFTEATGRAKL